jgi:hypothetical protein
MQRGLRRDRHEHLRRYEGAGERGGNEFGGRRKLGFSRKVLPLIFKLVLSSLSVVLMEIYGIFRRTIYQSSQVKRCIRSRQYWSYQQTDAPKIADVISIYEPLSLVPLQVIGCIILLWHILGLSFIPGLFVLICFMLINISLSTSIVKQIKKQRLQAHTNYGRNIRGYPLRCYD